MTTTIYTKTFATGAVLTVTKTMTVANRHGVNVSYNGKEIIERTEYAVDGKVLPIERATVRGRPEIVAILGGKYALTAADMESIKAAGKTAYDSYLASDECAEVRETNARLEAAYASEAKYIADRDAMERRMAYGER